jgi:hypothetical protein
VAAVCWSRVRGEDCVRVTGAWVGAEVRVRPRLTDVVGELPSMAGEFIRDGGDVCFVPRFGFVDGMTYAITVDGLDAGVLIRPRPSRHPTTDVVEIRPSARRVPRNLLRLYVRFSAPMSEGYAARHIRLLDDAGEVLTGALFPTEQELWDGDRVRLTVLLDPARIKRGLAPHREAGYPLRPGEAFRVVVDAGFRDAGGAVLRAAAERRYDVGDDERRRVDPTTWALHTPRRGTVDPLGVGFGRPLDHGLLARCLTVTGPDGQGVHGRAEIGPEERSWRFTPRSPWAPGVHHLVVDPVLEDVAGNSVRRVFDRDLTRVEDDPAEPGRDVSLSWPA